MSGDVAGRFEPAHRVSEILDVFWFVREREWDYIPVGKDAINSSVRKSVGGSDGGHC